jgi:hypothetical protein
MESTAQARTYVGQPYSLGSFCLLTLLNSDENNQKATEDDHTDHSNESDSTLQEGESDQSSVGSLKDAQERHMKQLKRKLAALKARKAKNAGKSAAPDELEDDLKDYQIIDRQQQQQQQQPHPTDSIVISKRKSVQEDGRITPNESAVFSPTSIVSSSPNIFERSVQDQATMSSISRRNSFNKMGALQKTLSFSVSPTQTHNVPSLKHPSIAKTSSYEHKCHQPCIPDHLNSENFVPTCLDASTEVLTDDNTDLANLEVIQSTNFHLNDILDQTYNKDKSKSAPLSRRQSTFDGVSSMSSHKPSIKDADSEEGIDYSDHKRLNFCSFADLLSDEYESGQISRVTTASSQSYADFDGSTHNFGSSFSMSPVSRKNSSIFVVPVLNSCKTAPIFKEAE